MRTPLVLCCVTLLTTSVLAQQQSRDGQTVTVGPWVIATTYKTEKFENCTMTRSSGELGITFVRAQDGLLVLLESPKWKLERGKLYSIRLVAGSQSLEAKAVAEPKSVTVPLPDRSFNAALQSANVLQVRGEGATLHVPLDGSSAALDRLDTCYEKNVRETAETNPFVAPSRKP